MRIGVTMKELKKIEVIKRLVRKEIKGVEAALLLGYHVVHISRLKKRYLENGELGLIRKNCTSPKKTKEGMKKKICRLKKKKYYDFNILHFNEKLYEFEDIKLSYETVRSILIEDGIHIPKKKKVTHRRKRKRMPKIGMLLQMDSSQHKWIKGIKKQWWLISVVDDATSKILTMKFFPSDNLFNNMEIITDILQQYGIFYSLYVDRASHFTTTRLGGLHVEVSVEQNDTNIERALDELGINLITAKSPQAKGRIERSFGTLQDRMIAEMRLHGITSYKKANIFIKEYFIEYYNKKFAKNLDNESVFKHLPDKTNLDLIFCKKYVRKVKNDNTISFLGNNIQLKPTKHKLSLAKHIVDICLNKDNKIYVLYKEKIILETEIKMNKKIKKQKNIHKHLEQRMYQNA